MRAKTVIENVLPDEHLAGLTYYHGTSDDAVCQQSLADGNVIPPEKSRGGVTRMYAPIPGRA